MRYAPIAPVEHYAIALTLAAVAAGLRLANPIPARRNDASRRIATAGRLLSRLGCELEMTIVPRTVRSPYFKNHNVVPPKTNEALIELFQNGIGVAIAGRVPTKIQKTYSKCVDALVAVRAVAARKADDDIPSWDWRRQRAEWGRR
jgi:hypothetical protein